MFDFEFTNEDKMAISKMIFVNWSPDGAPIKGRILYATAKESFKKYLDLNTRDHTISSKADVIIYLKLDDWRRHEKGTWPSLIKDQ